MNTFEAGKCTETLKSDELQMSLHVDTCGRGSEFSTHVLCELHLVTMSYHIIERRTELNCFFSLGYVHGSPRPEERGNLVT